MKSVWGVAITFFKVKNSFEQISGNHLQQVKQGFVKLDCVCVCWSDAKCASVGHGHKRPKGSDVILITQLHQV